MRKPQQTCPRALRLPRLTPQFRPARQGAARKRGRWTTVPTLSAVRLAPQCLRTLYSRNTPLRPQGPDGTTMQRLTKYRLLVCTFALATVALATYSVLLQRSSAQLRGDAADAQKHATESDRKLTDMTRLVEKLKHDAAIGGAADSN